MFSMRTMLVSAAAVLLASVAVNALPIPEVHPHHVHPGSVFVAKPAHFDPALVCFLYNDSCYCFLRFHYLSLDTAGPAGIGTILSLP